MPDVVQEALPFRGGSRHIQSYAASGTLTGVGSTRLHGTLIVPGHVRPGRLVGQLVLRNRGGRMIANVIESATPGRDSYQVARARGTDAGFQGESGTLTITRAQSFNVPFYASGEATLTFA